MLKIYNQYQTYGVKDYYQKFSNKYFNPHQDRIKTIYIKYIKDMISRNTSILDIACGDGLISRLVDHYNQNHNVDGMDPYFTNQYTKFNFSFEDIASTRQTPGMPAIAPQSRSRRPAMRGMSTVIDWRAMRYALPRPTILRLMD